MEWLFESPECGVILNEAIRCVKFKSNEKFESSKQLMKQSLKIMLYIEPKLFLVIYLVC